MLGWVLGAITIGCVCNALKDKRDEKVREIKKGFK